MELETVPDRGRFQVEILGDGKNVDVVSLDREVSLFVERKLVEGKIHLLIYGQCGDLDRVDSVSLKIVSDSGDGDGDWKYQMLIGNSGKAPRLTVRENRGRDIYALSAAVMTLLMGLRLFAVRREKDCREAESYSRKVMAKLLQEPGMERAWTEGRTLYLSMERRHLLNALFTGWLWLFTGFWTIHRLYHGADGAGQIALGVCMLGGLVALSRAARTAGRASVKEQLTGHCRPVTWATACLLMAGQGAGDRRDRVLWYHGEAAGLLRGGFCEEALALLRAVGPVPGKKDRDCMDYIHVSLECRCLAELGYEAEAGKAQEELDRVLGKNKKLRNRADVERNLVLGQIRQQIEAGEMELAEAQAQRLLNQCQKPYDRLPVLGVLAAVKEHLGKEAQARVLRSEILTFSPENREVRQAMAEGRLNFHQEGLSTRDNPGTGIRVACVMGICVLFLLMAMPSLWKVQESLGTVEQETGVAVNPVE